MSESLRAQAHKAALETVTAEKPQQFTVGGYYRDGRIEGGITYDRKWANLWGITAYAKAYWHDLPVTVNGATATIHRPTGEAGIEVSKKF